MYRFVINLRKHFLKNQKINWDNWFVPKGHKDVRVMSILSSFMSYYRSSHFSFFDFQMYFLMKILENEEFLNCTKLWMASDVKNVTWNDLETNLKKDREFLISVAKQTRVTSLEKFFVINKNGESIISSFYEKGYISLQFLVEYSTYFTENETETKKHRKLVKTLKIIKHIKKGK